MGEPSDSIASGSSTSNSGHDDIDINVEDSKTESVGSSSDDISVSYQLVKFIVLSELSFNLAESKWFEEMVQNSLNPQFERISRNTCRNYGIIIFKKAKEILKNVLQNIPAKLALTYGHLNKKLDILQQLHIILMLGHEQTNDCLLFKYPHHGLAIGSTIEKKLIEYNIINKIISISLDNASVNNGALEEMKIVIPLNIGGGLFYNKCVCRILNLIVHDGLKFIKPITNNIKKIITHIFMSPSRRQEFLQICKRHNKKTQKN